MSYYVYLIEQVNSPYCKIGVSNEPARRLGELQRKNPDRLAICYLFDCQDAIGAYKLESRLHRMYDQRRGHGEWFRIRAREVLYDVMDNAEIAGDILKITEYPEWVIEPAPKPKPIKVKPVKSSTTLRIEEMKWYFFFFAAGWFYSVVMLMLGLSEGSGMHTIEIVGYLLLGVFSVGGMGAVLNVSWHLNMYSTDGLPTNGHSNGANAPEGE